MSNAKVIHDGIIISEADKDLYVYPLSSCAYPRCWFDGERYNLHYIVMRRILQIVPPIHLDIDHINGNPLDCRRENLQLLWHRDNVAKGHSKNSYLRVGYRKSTDRWRVRFTLEGKQGEFGTYKTAEEAAYWADVYAYRILPEGSLLNFPERLDEIRKDALALSINYPWQRNPHQR